MQQPPVSYRRSALELHSLTGRNLLQYPPMPLQTLRQRQLQENVITF